MSRFSVEMFTASLRAAGYEPTQRGLENLLHDFQKAKGIARKCEELGVGTYELDYLEKAKNEAGSSFNLRDLLEVSRLMKKGGVIPTAMVVVKALEALEDIDDNISNLPWMDGTAELYANVAILRSMLESL